MNTRFGPRTTTHPLILKTLGVLFVLFLLAPAALAAGVFDGGGTDHPDETGTRYFDHGPVNSRYEPPFPSIVPEGQEASVHSYAIALTGPKPITDFSVNVNSGTAPLTVSFTDLSLNNPSGWAWYFGDETFTAPWTEVKGADWSGRYAHSSVAMPDGSIVLMGGNDGSLKNDVWRSMDNGTTWIQVNASAGWTQRWLHSSVAMPDGSIVLMGGYDGYFRNDVWRSTDNGATWIEVNASAGWTQRWLHSSVAMPDGSIVLMGGWDNTYNYKNDVWRSTDNGATWIEVNASAGWTPRDHHSSVAMPDGSIVLMGGYDGYFRNDVWRSTDNGATWIEVNASAGWTPRYFHSSVAMPDGSIVLMGGWDNTYNYKNDVWRSTDNGTTWIQVNASAGWTPRDSHSSVAMPDGSIVLMGGYSWGIRNDVWRSTDNGTTWIEVYACAGWTPRESHSSVAMPDGSIVLMGGLDGYFRNDVWRSTDNGATWIEVNASAGWTPRYFHSSVAMPDGSIVLMGGNDGYSYKNDVWRSTNNGATWTLVNVSAGWTQRWLHSSVAMPDGSIVLMGGYDNTSFKNDTWRSTDNGATWSEVNASAGWTVRGYHSSVAMPDGSIVLMGGFAGGFKNDVWRSMDNGASWIQMTASAGWAPRDRTGCVAMPDGSIVLMGGWNYSFWNDVWRSMDNGATWTQVNVNAGWTPRDSRSSVAMPDGSIVLMGGWDGGRKNDVWRLVPAGSSAQNPVHTYTTPGIYQVALQAYNAGGYTSMRKTGYITVMAPFPSDSSEDYPSSFTNTTGVSRTEIVNVGGGSAVTRAAMTGTGLGKNLVITAMPRSSLPATMAPPPTTVYQYLSITSSTITGVVSQITLDFSVPQSWLTEHGFTIGDIVMMHYVDGEWQTLDTLFVSQKSGYVYYRATTTGLSYFAIAYQKGGTTMGTGTPVPTTLAPAESPVTETPSSPVTISAEKTQTVAPAPVTAPVEGMPQTTVIVGIIGVIAIITGAFLVRRWWIRRQNPALFREYD